jgi:FkbM family methyltransferase
MAMTIGTYINRLLAVFGYEIRKKGPGKVRTSMGQSYALLKKNGLAPGTIIDVGVASGTPSLYNAFPEADLLLVEPLEEFEAAIKTILSRRRGTYVIGAAGAVPGEVEFYKHVTHLSGSSLYRETMGEAADGLRIKVPMVRLDDVVKAQSPPGPYLLKIDAQGAELDVLDGFGETIAETDVIVLEVSMFGFMKGAPQFYDVVRYMHQQQFAAYDIILNWNRPLDGALGQVDIVFVRENGVFRHDHAYSTVEQMRAILG